MWERVKLELVSAVDGCDDQLSVESIASWWWLLLLQDPEHWVRAGFVLKPDTERMETGRLGRRGWLLEPGIRGRRFGRR